MNKLKNILIIILFGVIVFQTISKTKQKPLKPEIITKTDTITLSVPHYIPKPYPVYHDTGSYHAVPVYLTKPTDTAAIVADYIQKIAYSDTLMNNDKAFILVVDTLQYNRIQSRSKTIHIYSRTKTIRIPERAHFFAGLGIGGNKHQFGFLGNLALQTKRGKLYTVQYDLINKSVFVSLYWRIK